MATNKPPLMSVKYVGEIAILRIQTEKLFDSDRVVPFFEEVSAAIGQRSRIILDIGQVMLMSSVALKELILIRTRYGKSGCRIILCCANPPVRDLFRVSQLDLLFEFAATVEEALAALRWSLAVECPIAGCEGDARTCDPSIADRGGDLCCRSCGSRFRVACFQLSPDGEARVAVSRFEIPTYEQEWIRAELGPFVKFDIVGRMDLFATEVLVDALRSLPTSCLGLLDLRAATELSEAGLRLLEEHLRADASCDRIVVLIDADRSGRVRVHSGLRIAMRQDEARSILPCTPESAESPAPLFVSARTVQSPAEDTRSRDGGTPTGGPRPSKLKTWFKTWFQGHPTHVPTDTRRGR
jgi:anti-anti-sigma factor